MCSVAKRGCVSRSGLGVQVSSVCVCGVVLCHGVVWCVLCRKSFVKENKIGIVFGGI